MFGRFFGFVSGKNNIFLIFNNLYSGKGAGIETAMVSYRAFPRVKAHKYVARA